MKRFYLQDGQPVPFAEDELMFFYGADPDNPRGEWSAFEQFGERAGRLVINWGQGLVEVVEDAADQPLSNCEFPPWVQRISAEEFEAYWTWGMEHRSAGA